MSAVDWVVLVVTIVVGIVLGLFFGALPMKTEKMSESQQKYSSVAGIVAVGIIVILIIVHQDLASWFAVGALVVGFAIAKIAPLHRWILGKFTFFKPVEKKSGPRKRQ